MKYISLSACLILLVITGCKAQVADSQSTAHASLHSSLKSKDEKPCLNNLVSSLAGCANGTAAQKRFVLVRSVAIPEN